jgi:trans-2,3-dihydro-3-hydroxyanthranilate isomerase
MNPYAFRIVNVFAEQHMAGNPLCVFEDARGLTDAQMLALARQFNLSETTFVLPATVAGATAKVRIFTPGYEMRFAGHPTLGTAHVLRAMGRGGDKLVLEYLAGLVPVVADADRWTLTAPMQGAPKVTKANISRAQMAQSLGLGESDLCGDPTWVDTGTDQLLVPARSPSVVRRAVPQSTLLASWPLSSLGRKSAYLFAFDESRPREVLSRYFFSTSGDGVAEDAGTGSACANLGGWLMHQAGPGHQPCEGIWQIDQGEQTGRRCHLTLRVTGQGGICVGGAVVEFAKGQAFI